MTRHTFEALEQTPDGGRSAWARRQPVDGSFDVAGPAGWMARRAMQMHPEIEPNFRATLNAVVGPGFSPSEIERLHDRALDQIEMQDLNTLQGIHAGAPVTLTERQKARIDRLMGLVGKDALGQRARDAYGEAVRTGKIRVR